MKYSKKILAVLASGAMLLSMAGCGTKNDDTTDTTKAEASDTQVETSDTTEEKATEINYVASFYPMYILSENLTKDIDNVKLSCMADMNFGCIHDYTMKTEDLKNIENATAFIENGFDLEPFNDNIEQAYPDMTIIKSSDGIDITKFGYESLAADEDEDEDESKEGSDKPIEAGTCCGSTELNPHVWTDVNLYIEQVKNVAEAFKKADPDNSAAYADNCDKYLEKLNSLKADIDNLKKDISGKKAVVLDETLPNMCHSVGIEFLFIETDHEQQSLSAADLKNVIDSMKKDDIKAIFIGKNADDSAAKILADETGATIYELNTCMVGDDDADAYINDMTENLNTFKSIK